MKMEKISLVLILILLNIVIWFPFENSDASTNDITVVVHKSRPGLSEAQIRRIFMGDMTSWPNGGKIKALINRNESIGTNFLSQYLNMSKADFSNIWINKQIRDGVQLPKECSSAIIQKLIASSPRYIGFVKKSEVSSSVKVVK